MAKYWHELSKEEQEEVKKSGITIAEFLLEYAQPDWCLYPNALEGRLGCWSLVDGYIHSEEDCKTCDCYKPNAKLYHKKCPVCGHPMEIRQISSATWLRVIWECHNCKHLEQIFPPVPQKKTKQAKTTFNGTQYNGYSEVKS